MEEVADGPERTRGVECRGERRPSMTESEGEGANGRGGRRLGQRGRRVWSAGESAGRAHLVVFDEDVGGWHKAGLPVLGSHLPPVLVGRVLGH